MASVVKGVDADKPGNNTTITATGILLGCCIAHAVRP